MADEDEKDGHLADLQDDDMESIRVNTAAPSPAPPPPPWLPPVLAKLPSENELNLTQRVIDLERERDTLAARIKDLEARFPSFSSSIDAAPSETSVPGIPVAIPPELVPVLAILRKHIWELTRENAALRYTFLGVSSRPDIATSSKVTLDTVLTPGSSVATTPIPTDSPPIGIEVTPPPRDPAPPPAGLGFTPIVPTIAQPTISVPSRDVDLHAVVERVKTLMLENDELGEMVAEAGRTDGEEWAKTLTDTKSVIASLDADLAHNMTVIEGLRAEMQAYKTQFGPLNFNGQTPTAQGRDRDHRDRDRDRDRGGGGGGRNDRRRNGSGAGTGSAGGRGEDRYGGDRDRDRDREQQRDKDHDRDRPGGGGRGQSRTSEGHRRDDRRDDRRSGGGSRDVKQGGVGGQGQGITLIGRSSENGTSRRDDDRASKRRR